MLLSDLTGEQMIMLILPALPNMWALKHAMYHDFPTPREKYRWMMACVFLPCIGGLAYYLVGRKHASEKELDIFDVTGQGETHSVPDDHVLDDQADDAGVAQVPAAVEQPVEKGGEPAAPGAGAEQDGSRSAADKPSAARDASADGWSFGCPDDGRSLRH